MLKRRLRLSTVGQWRQEHSGGRLYLSHAYAGIDNEDIT